jgi:hypothetical protein
MYSIADLDLFGQYTDLGREHQFDFPPSELERLAAALEAMPATDGELRFTIGSVSIRLITAQVVNASAGIDGERGIRLVANQSGISELARKLRRIAQSKAGTEPNHIHLEPWLIDSTDEVADIVIGCVESAIAETSK